MINIEQDIKITYSESEGIANKTTKNNLVILEDLKSTDMDVRFVQQIFKPDDIKKFASNNKTLNNFNSMFFAQTNRPSSYFLCATSVLESNGILESAKLEQFEIFKKRYEINTLEGDIISYSPIVFNIKSGSELTEYTYKISGKELAVINNYYALFVAIARQNIGALQITIPDAGILNLLICRTVGSGNINGQIDFMTKHKESSAIDFPAMLKTGIIDKTWDEVLKVYADANLTDMVFDIMGKEGGEDEVRIHSYNLPLSEVTSWNSLIEKMQKNSTKLNISFIKDHIVFIPNDTAEGKAITAMGYLNSTDKIGHISGHEADGTTASMILRGTKKDNAIIIPKSQETPTEDSSLNLKSNKFTPNAKIRQGMDNISNTPEFMNEFALTLYANRIKPNVIVVSRNLTNDEYGNTDLKKLYNIISGFNSYFSGSSFTGTTVLAIHTDTKKITINLNESNPFQNFIGKTNSRNLCIQYSNNSEEYLDGAIASFIAGINWEGTKVTRNTKGLSFNNIIPSYYLETNDDTTLMEYRINYYAEMDNSMSMFRNGQTASTGDVGFIDITAGLNALIIDLKDKLMRLIKNGKLENDVEGSNLIYNLISMVCEKYKNNGFLSDTVMQTFTDGESVVSPVPAYVIYVPRIFTQEQINERTFPDIKLYISSTRFVNTISLNIQDIINI